MNRRKLLIYSFVALLICIVSAIIASEIPGNDADGRPNWDNFTISIWITLIVTVPAFCIFVVMALAALFRRKKK